MRYALLMLALLAGSTLHASSPFAGYGLSYTDSYAKYTTWGWACELTVDCVGLEVPEVAYLPPGNTGRRGAYDGGDTILISPSLRPGVDRMSTLIHEMIHYIHVQQGHLATPFTAEGVCWSEATAFRLVDSWFDLKGYPQFKRGPDWWHSYPHCWPYYKDSQ